MVLNMLKFPWRIINFLANIYWHRETIRIMALREISAKYIGTLGGGVWALVHPITLVLIYWFVFSVGFKVKGPGDSPFILYFTSGMLPWLTFSEVLMTSTHGVTANPNLVKKIVFPTEVLPVVYLLAASVTSQSHS